MRITLWVIAAAFLLLCSGAVQCAPVTVESGVTVDVTGSPLNVVQGDVVSRTITIQNSNATKQRTYDIGFTYVVSPTPVHAALTATGTISGVRKAREIQVAVPIDFLVVPGSLKIDGVAQPNPVINGGYYTVKLDLRIGSTIIADQLQFDPLP